MDKQDIKGLKYFIAYAMVIVGFSAYSSFTGWMWFNPTKTEPTKGEGRRPGSHGHIYRYHK